MYVSTKYSQPNVREGYTPSGESEYHSCRLLRQAEMKLGHSSRTFPDRGIASASCIGPCQTTAVAEDQVK